MTTVRAIFENGVFRPTEPVTLSEGSQVKVLVPDAQDAHVSGDTDDGSRPRAPVLPRSPMVGSAKGLFQISDDFDAPLEDFAPYM